MNVVIENDQLHSHFPSQPSNSLNESKEIKFSPFNPSKSTVLTDFAAKWNNMSIRSIGVPVNRFVYLKSRWAQIYTPIVEQLKLQIRMNVKKRQVEIKPSPETVDIASLDQAVEFVRACILGFEVADALAILRIEDIYVESFSVDDVKELHGDHLSRAIGRIAGKDGRTKFTIENSTRTRIVLADKKIHLMGSFQNIKIARDTICNLIMGSPPNKIYSRLKVISKRLKERF